MQSSQLPALLERLKTDEDLRAKFLEAETSARRQALEIRTRIDQLADANIATLHNIAEEAGYNISDAIKRPSDFQVTPTEQEFESFSWSCVFTCCFVATSAWSTETFGPRCMEGPPWMTL
jgi:hypothetical protein